MEATGGTATLDVQEAVTKIAEGELTPDAFRELSVAVYQSNRSRDQLADLLDSWDDITASGSKTNAAILKGYAQLLLGRLADAEETLRKHRSTEWGGYYLTRTLLESGKDDEALQLAEELREKYKDSREISFNLVEVWCHTGWEAEAPKVLEKLGKDDPDSGELAFHSALYKERTGEYREAIDLYRQASERDPENAEAFFRLGYLLDLYGTDEEEQSDESVTAYEHCLRIAPVHTNAVMNLGLLYEDRERYHDAAKCFETVLKAHPDHARAKLYLGDAIAATQMFYDKELEKKADRHSQVLKIPVTDFELSVRSRNCLHKMNIETLGDLIMKTEQELLSYKNFGETSLQEIKDMLSQKGLRLGQGLEESGSDLPTGRNPLEATVSSEILDRPIEELNLSVRSRRCMERLEVRSVRDLINKTEVELMSAKNFGMTSLNEIKMKLAELGLSLRS